MVSNLMVVLCGEKAATPYLIPEPSINKINRMADKKAFVLRIDENVYKSLRNGLRMNSVVSTARLNGFCNTVESSGKAETGIRQETKKEMSIVSC
jgi:hypothetical protein